jgi:hypothetical protein
MERRFANGRAEIGISGPWISLTFVAEDGLGVVAEMAMWPGPCHTSADRPTSGLTPSVPATVQTEEGH